MQATLKARSAATNTPAMASRAERNRAYWDMEIPRIYDTKWGLHKSKAALTVKRYSGYKSSHGVPRKVWSARRYDENLVR